MANYAKITICGYLAKDPEARQVGENKVVNLSIPITKKTGQEERTTWYNVSLWNAQGEYASKYLKKGHQVTVMGDHSTRTYQDKDGNQKTSEEINNGEVHNHERKPAES